MMEQVYIIPLKKVLNERGHLMEVQRIDDSHYLGFGQVYITATLPNIIKAWYRHHEQTDQIAIVKGLVRLVLYDSRPQSNTFGQVQEIMMDEHSPVLVQIPIEVWHGFRAEGENAAFLMHLNSVPFNASKPDEDRLDPRSEEIPYRWS